MKVLIVGLGLIGASYAKGLTKKGYEVYGCDLLDDSNKFALESGFVLAASKNPLDFINQVDLIILGLYPRDIVPFLLKYQPYFKAHQIISDVCGIKASICYEATKASLPAMFVGSHPMAGREKIGIHYADEKIFHGANFLICPIEGTEDKAVLVMEEVARALEFKKIHKISPEHHDLMIAYTSQLTHAIAVSLVNSESSVDVSSFIGDSYRDLTRIAMINDKLWSELFLDNKEALLKEIQAFKCELAKVETAIKESESSTLTELFKKSKAKRELM